MNTIQKLTTHMIPGLDRINISIPLKYSKKFTSKFDQDYRSVDKKPSKRYWQKDYLMPYGRVQFSSLRHDVKNRHGFERNYTALLDATESMQVYVKDLLSYSTPGTGYGIKSPKVNQIEVSYDFYAESDADLIKIRNYVENHFILKHRRADSSCYIRVEDKDDPKYRKLECSTFYVGRKGDIRKGNKGFRSYIKTENGKTFYRFEVQLNAGYLEKIGFTYMDLPVSPFYFQALDLIDILDDFSFIGIQKLSKAILWKQGIKVSSPGFKEQYREMFQYVSDEILGPGNRGPNRRIYSQICSHNDLRTEHDVTTNFKDYFPDLHEVRELVSCHAAIGYHEYLTSKRIIHCCL